MNLTTSIKKLFNYKVVDCIENYNYVQAMPTSKGYLTNLNFKLYVLKIIFWDSKQFQIKNFSRKKMQIASRAVILI